MGKRKPRAIDLFAGAGGLSEGLRQAGYKLLGAVENDELAARTYKLNHPGVKIWTRDIRTITGPELMKGIGAGRRRLDLLAACPPCQGFSRMRTKNGVRRNQDPKNALVFDVLRLTRSTRPRAVMLENVPGLAKSRRFRRLCKALASLGYRVKWAILNTEKFAVPQRRRRLVLLATESGMPDFAAEAVQARTVRQAIGNLAPPSKSKDSLHNYRAKRSAKVRKIILRIPKNGGSRSALGKNGQLPCHRKASGFRDVYGRMSWDAPAPTITGGCINPSKGRFIHPVADRAITLREAALLQSFPKSYKFAFNDNRYAVALLIGNALPPEFIRRHALALKGSMRRRAS